VELEEVTSEEEFMALLSYFDGQARLEGLAVGAEELEGCVGFAAFFDAVIGVGEDSLAFGGGCDAACCRNCQGYCSCSNISQEIASVH